MPFKSKALLPIQIYDTLRNGKSFKPLTKSNQFQTRKQTQCGINRKATTNDAETIERRNTQAANAWHEVFSRVDSKKSENPENSFYWKSFDSKKLKGIKILVCNDSIGKKIRTSSNNGRIAWKAIAQQGARASQKRKWIGQQSRQFGIDESCQSQSVTWQKALVRRNDSDKIVAFREMELAL